MEAGAQKARGGHNELLDDLAQRGAQIYESKLRDALERDFMGQIVAIHVDSGDYAVAGREEVAMSELRRKQSEGLLFVRRIGPPTPGDLRLAARLDRQSKS